MYVMHNRAISEEHFIWQVQERWTLLLYDMAGAHNGLQDMAQTVRVKGPILKKTSWVAIWRLSDKNQVELYSEKNSMHKVCKNKFSRLFWLLILCMHYKRHNQWAYMTHSMLKGLQCIIGRFQTRSAICKFSDVRGWCRMAFVLRTYLLA